MEEQTSFLPLVTCITQTNKVSIRPAASHKFRNIKLKAEGPQSWSGHRRHSTSAAGAIKSGGVPRKIMKFSFSKMWNGAFSKRNEQKMKQKSRWHMHVLSSKLNKFISYNGSLEWNFKPLMVNGNTVVLNHANQEVGLWRSSKSAHVSIIARYKIQWFRQK